MTVSIVKCRHEKLAFSVPDVTVISSWHAVAHVFDPIVIRSHVHVIFDLKVFIKYFNVSEKHKITVPSKNIRKITKLYYITLFCCLPRVFPSDLLPDPVL